MRGGNACLILKVSQLGIRFGPALAIRLLTDLSVVTSSFVIRVGQYQKAGFMSDPIQIPTTLNYQALKSMFDATPGLVADKFKAVLEFIWPYVQGAGHKGIVFAYD